MRRIAAFFANLAAATAFLSGAKRAWLSVLLGLVSVFAFAPVHFWPVLFLSFGGLLWLLDGCHEPHKPLNRRLKCAALTGFWFGFGFFLAGLYWVAEAFLVEPWRHGWLIPFVMVALPGGLALFYAAAGAFAMMLWREGAARVIALSIAFGLAEFARGHVLTGFPWNLIGYGLLANEASMQVASVFGVYALSLMAVLLFASPAGIWSPGRTRSTGAVVLTAFSLAVFGAFYVWGSARLATAPPETGTLSLRMVQANVDQADKWRPEKSVEIFSRYLDLTRTSGLEGIDVVVWPETALPFLLDDSPDALTAIGDALPPQTVLLVGAARVVEGPDTDRRQFFNSLLAVNAEGRVIAAYDKIHLVPFGEYLPFQDFLEGLGVMQLTGIRGGFSEGTGPRLLEVPGLPLAMPLICYEIIFPHQVLERDGRSRWLLNVTNDAWFGSSAGPYQHLHQARVRAVEQGLPLVRSANTGISAVIDPWGRSLVEIGLNEDGVADAKLPKPIPSTIYTTLGLKIETIVLAFAIFGWILCHRTLREVKA